MIRRFSRGFRCPSLHEMSPGAMNCRAQGHFTEVLNDRAQITAARLDCPQPTGAGCPRVQARTLITSPACYSADVLSQGHCP